MSYETHIGEHIDDGVLPNSIIDIENNVKRPKNTNFNKAKREKNDEFYTQLDDVYNELKHYKNQFKNKIVFCNCDDPRWSSFWKYFSDNFQSLGLKKLISTHYEKNGSSYKLEIVRDVNGDGAIDDLDTIETSLKGNGDFRSSECVELLKQADIVVTNPPFSLFREYVDLLMEHDKKFLIIGNMNAITYKETFKLIKENKIWLGYNYGGACKEFQVPNSYHLYGSKTRIDNDGNKYIHVSGIKWFTNLNVQKRSETLILTDKYRQDIHPSCDNYDAINIDKVKNIPVNYDEKMAVPISFLDKYNPDQFEIIGNEYDLNIEKGRCYVNGNRKYSRIIIRKVA